MSDIMVLVWSLLLPTLCSIWQSTPLFLLGESPWTDEPGGLQSIGRKQRDTTEATKHSTALVESACNVGAAETQIQSLGREDPLEEKATHSSILAWKIPWTEVPGRL